MSFWGCMAQWHVSQKEPRMLSSNRLWARNILHPGGVEGKFDEIWQSFLRRIGADQKAYNSAGSWRCWCDIVLKQIETMVALHRNIRAQPEKVFDLQSRSSTQQPKQAVHLDGMEWNWFLRTSSNWRKILGLENQYCSNCSDIYGLWQISRHHLLMKKKCLLAWIGRELLGRIQDYRKILHGVKWMIYDESSLRRSRRSHSVVWQEQRNMEETNLVKMFRKFVRSGSRMRTSSLKPNQADCWFTGLSAWNDNNRQTCRYLTRPWLKAVSRRPSFCLCFPAQPTFCVWYN